MNIRYIDSPPLEGDFNMGCDFTFGAKIKPGRDGLFRTYTWMRPTISLGFHQKLEDIDLNRCAEEGVDVVRRPTGGRAIYHWGEITYSFIHPADQRAGRSAVREVYGKVHLAIASALRTAGVRLTPSAGKKSRIGHNPLCFASEAGTELELEGRKVVGSAQRRLETAILQHGSILISDSHLRLPDYLNLADEDRARLLKLLWESSSFLPIEDSEELRRSLAQSIGEVFRCGIYESRLTSEESAEVESVRGGFSLFKSVNRMELISENCLIEKT